MDDDLLAQLFTGILFTILFFAIGSILGVVSQIAIIGGLIYSLLIFK